MADRFVGRLRSGLRAVLRLAGRTATIALRALTWPLRAWWCAFGRAHWLGRTALVAASFVVVLVGWLAVAIPWPGYLLTPPFRPVEYEPLNDLQYLRPERADSGEQGKASACRARQALCAEARTVAAHYKDFCAETLGVCASIEQRCSGATAKDRTCIDSLRSCTKRKNACTAEEGTRECADVETAHCGQAEETWQGWTREDRMRFYYHPQGSAQVMLAQMRYAWFVHLEKASGRARFAAPENMARYGFLTDINQQPDPNWNPDNLPVGFAKYFDTNVGAELLDFTCSLCHTGELHYKGTAVRILGGQAMHAITDMKPGQFQADMMLALLATYLNPWKFDRFAHNVIDPTLSGATPRDLHFDFDAAKRLLGEQFGDMVRTLLANAWTDLREGNYPVFEGYGRTDATQRIANTVFGRHISPSNYRPATAPVNYPQLWDVSKFNWVQWEGYASQPMARNINESLGVGARLDLFDDVGAPLPLHLRYQTSIQPDKIQHIEETLAKLKAPLWPEHLFGSINMAKARAGRALFDVNCRHCHGPFNTPVNATPAGSADRSPAVQWSGSTCSVRSHDGEMKTLTPQQCLNLQNPARVADIDGHFRYEIDAHGQVTGLACDLHHPDSAVCTRDQIAAAGVLCRTGHGDPEACLRDLENDEAGTVCESHNSRCAIEEWRLERLPIREIGTDRHAALNFTRNTYDVSRLGWTENDLRRLCLAQDTIGSIDPKKMTAVVGLNIMSLSIARTYFKRHPAGGNEELMKIMGFGILDFPSTEPAQLESYKSRPLHGIWATPPFLHNGSVRTVYQVISPRSERQRSFWSGTKEYDPVHMGYIDADVPGAVRLDTQVTGNDNVGHEFTAGCQKNGVIGHLLAPDERLAIIEYLKVMDYTPDDQKQVRAACGGWKPCEDEVAGAGAAEAAARKAHRLQGAIPYELALCRDATTVKGKAECFEAIAAATESEHQSHPSWSADANSAFKQSEQERHCSADDSLVYGEPTSKTPARDALWESWKVATGAQCSIYRDLREEDTPGGN